MKKYEQFENAEDYFEMASAWKDEGDYEKAEKYYHYAIENNRYFTYAYIELAELYEETGRLKQSIKVIEDAQDKDPKFKGLPLLKAEYNFKMGRYADAEEALVEARALGGEKEVDELLEKYKN